MSSEQFTMSQSDGTFRSFSKGFVKDYTDLLAYRKSFHLSKEIFETTKNFPKEEMYSLTDQFRRAIRSVGANIAEAWAKRRYEKYFISKLTDADAERSETQHRYAVSHIMVTSLRSKWAVGKAVRAGLADGGRISESIRNRRATQPAAHFHRNPAGRGDVAIICETVHQLRTSYACGYIDSNPAEQMNQKLLEIGRLLNGMIEKSSAFLISDHRVREDPSVDEFF